MAFVDLRKTGECSDICVTVEGHSLKLHQFPLFARSDYFKALIRSKLDDANSVVLESLPGGLEVMNLVADFCYEIDISSKIHCKNVGPLICGASYLQMVGSNNLLEQAQKKLRLLSKKAINCLQVLAGCAAVPESADSEGLVKHCTEWLVILWRSEGVLSRDEKFYLRELPSKWLLELLARMKTKKGNSSTMARVIEAYIDWSEYWEKSEWLLEAVAFNQTTKAESTDQKQTEKLFDALLEYAEFPKIWHSFTSGVVSDTWACHSLVFSEKHSLKCFSKLLEYCASFYSRLPVKAWAIFSPILVNKLNKVNAPANLSEYKRNEVCALTEEYLLHHCSQAAMDAGDFVIVMNSISELRNPESSFDLSFKALEALLQSSLTLSQDDITTMSRTIDFAALSEKCLDGAASHDKIPQSIVLSGAVRLCKTLTSELGRIRKNSISLRVEMAALKSQKDETQNKLLREIELLKTKLKIYERK